MEKYKNIKNNQLTIGAYRRFYNKNLKEIMNKSGMTASFIHKKTGLNKSILSRIINFKRNPSEEMKIKLAIVLNTTIDSIFPENYDEIYNRLSPLQRQGEIKIELLSLYSPEVLMLESPDVIDEIIDNVNNFKWNKKVAEAMDKCCTPREIKVLKCRFGIDDGISKTYDEVAKLFEVTRERIRQVEFKSLEKIKDFIIKNNY